MTKAARALGRRLGTRSTASQVLIITTALMLMASIGLGSALAARSLITSRDIKNRTVRNADLATNSVNDRAIAANAVGMSALTSGVKGQLASNGAKGDVGPAGPAGPKGDTGPKGDSGAKGDKGEQGDIGPAGPPGYSTLVTPFNDQFKDNTTTASSDTPWAVTDLKCSDTSLNGEVTKGFQNGQPGGQDAPLQTGAYGFTLNDNDSVILLGLRKYDGQNLSTLSELHYSERFNGGPSTTGAPSVEILVDNNNDGDSTDPGDDQLIFEPAENTDQGSIAQDGRWQSWNVVDGKVRVGANPAASFASYVANHPDATIQGTSYAGGIRLRAESCGQDPGYEGAFDNVTVNGTGGRVIYDFEAS